MAVHTAAPRKKDVALAFIIERIVRSGVSPSFPEIAAELGVSVARVKHLVEQLIRDGRVERTPGAQRGLRVRDVVECRTSVVEALRRLGFSEATAVPFPQEHLPLLPELDHIPAVDWPGDAA